MKIAEGLEEASFLETCKSLTFKEWRTLFICLPIGLLMYFFYLGDIILMFKRDSVAHKRWVKRGS